MKSLFSPKHTEDVLVFSRQMKESQISDVVMKNWNSNDVVLLSYHE